MRGERGSVLRGIGNFKFDYCRRRKGRKKERADGLWLADAVPEGLEVVVGESETLDGSFVAAGLDGFLEPGPRFVETTEACGVAGEVVWDERFFWKKCCRGKQGIPGFLEAAIFGATNGVGAMNPAIDSLRGDGDLPLGDVSACFPALGGGANLPADGQDVWIVEGLWGKAGDFFSCFSRVAEFEPADGCAQVVQVGRMEFSSGHFCHEPEEKSAPSPRPSP